MKIKRGDHLLRRIPISRDVDCKIVQKVAAGLSATFLCLAVSTDCKGFRRIQRRLFLFVQMQTLSWQLLTQFSNAANSSYLSSFSLKVFSSFSPPPPFLYLLRLCRQKHHHLVTTLVHASTASLLEMAATRGRRSSGGKDANSRQLEMDFCKHVFSRLRLLQQQQPPAPKLLVSAR